jgi:para-nitrobenzyl esterase
MSVSAPVQTVEVQTSYGKVSGIVEGGIARFLGIPYARAPIGDLRFAAPAAPQPWDGVRPAHRFGPTAPKPPLGGGLGAITSDPDIEGDDWLNLNVWRPEPAATGLPVLVWIHGGGFTTGSSAVPTYDGATFARDGVVCVSLNYRLGVDGFGYLPDAPAPANRGLLDQVAALRWVRDNIAAFGGDPDRVTVCGESAGAMSVLALLSRDDGLFHRAIVQSGTAHLGQTREDAALVLDAVGTRLGVPATAEALAAVEIAELIRAQGEISGDVSLSADPIRYGPSTIAACGLSFMPVIDGEVLGRLPIHAIADGAGRGVPLLTGTTTEEFRLFVVTSDLLLFGTAEMFKERLDAYGAPRELFDFYKASDAGAYPRDAASGVACAVLTDRMFRIPTYRVAEARAGQSASTHVYEFGWRSPVTPNILRVKLGACHSVDLPFAWDTLDLPENHGFTGPNPPRPLADALHGVWAEFAATGQVPWHPYEPIGRTVMTYQHNNADGNVPVGDPRGDERRQWEGLLPAR